MSFLSFFFFFSSRRRHTRFKCDWSSDVCSSDLCCCKPSPVIAERSRRTPGHPALSTASRFFSFHGLRKWTQYSLRRAGEALPRILLLQPVKGPSTPFGGRLTSSG